MALAREKFREIVFQLLYSMEFTPEMDESLLTMLMIKLKVARKSVKEAHQKVLTIWPNLSAIDEMIKSRASGYEFHRILSVEKTILRLAFYEMIHEKLPVPVAISEALRLCKKFSTKDSLSFVNAILDAENREAKV